jgi:hypothetical protein
MSKPITATMAIALVYAQEHDGRLIRHAGGFWADKNWSHGKESFGTTTVEALVARGRMTYTDFKQTARGKFPVEATIVLE